MTTPRVATQWHARIYLDRSGSRAFAVSGLGNMDSFHRVQRGSPNGGSQAVGSLKQLVASQ